MHTVPLFVRRFVASTAAASTIALAGVGIGAGTSGASTPTTVPQVSVARAAAQWLSAQFTPQGYLPGSMPGSAQYSETASSLLALASANVDLPLARTGLAYLEANTGAYVTVDGGDGPGQLSLLILVAHALGADPTKFGGSNLVSRLLATEQTTGPNAGRFGTDTQVADFNSGPYDQGLALVALKAAGVTANQAASTWLVAAQCTDGGWTAPDSVSNPCNGDPAQFLGPDTNTTALALEGLVAQGALTPTVQTRALGFLQAGQNADGGWAYDPNAPDNQQTSDPNSTSLVMQALLALGRSPDAAPFVVGGNTPTSVLLSFRVAGGADAGAISTAGSPTAGNVFATMQAVPALMGLSFGFGPQTTSYSSYWLASAGGGVYPYGSALRTGTLGSTPARPVVGITATRGGAGYWLVASDGGIFSFGDGAFFGSMGGKALNEPIVGMASTPDSQGYWLVASDGGIFSFGDAAFFGSMGGKALNEPIVGMAATRDGKGYWLVASDGGIFSFGDAPFIGSMGGKALNEPIVGMAPTPDSQGYWLVASDGGIFAYGDAPFIGSMGDKELNEPIVGMAATLSGGGYWLLASDGGVFTYGDAAFSGSAAGSGAGTSIVGIAAGGS